MYLRYIWTIKDTNSQGQFLHGSTLGHLWDKTVESILVTVMDVYGFTDVEAVCFIVFDGNSPLKYMYIYTIYFVSTR